jgi:thymidylate synthase
MKQYIELLQAIKSKGTKKGEARENMPNTLSLFGYQNRYDLSEGFPLVTTKKVNFKHIVTELLWFLKGDTNVKFLIDNGCNIWNQDAYNYYLKKCKRKLHPPMSFSEFSDCVIRNNIEQNTLWNDYILGDAGKQYGWLWRNWEKSVAKTLYPELQPIDQFKDLLKGLKTNPMGRRHIITAWNPATLDDMALNACHSFVQFNCRPIPWEEKLEMAKRHPNVDMENLAITEAAAGNPNFGPIPQYYLDCQLYQRSADAVLGVPYNIASYALLTEILSKICNMIPGEFIHTFGDVHIYSNHMEAVEEQLQREPRPLPTLNINTEFWPTENGSCGEGLLSIDGFLEGLNNPYFIKCLIEEDIQLINYNPHPKLKAETKLSTGLI